MAQGDAQGYCQLKAQRGDRVRHVALRTPGYPEGCNLWERQTCSVRCDFFSTGIAASFQALGHQKAIRRNAQGAMVVKPAPASALVVAKPQILLEVLIIALDAPTHMCGAHQIARCGCLGQRGKVVFFRLSLTCGPLDEQPLLGQQARLAHVAPGAAYPHCCKAPR